MPVTANGPISFQDIQDEWDGSHPISLTEYYGLYPIPDSGVISVDTFRGTTNSMWDTSSATYLPNNAFGVRDQDNGPVGAYFKPDGTKLYMLGHTNEKVFEYNMGTPWDIRTMSYVQEFFVGDKDFAPQEMTFKPDGTKMLFVGDQHDKVYAYNLSTPWDITTASYEKDFSLGVGKPYSADFKPDGTRFWVASREPRRITEYNLSTPWDLSTASSGITRAYASGELEYHTHTGTGGPAGSTIQEVWGMFFKPDGTAMYLSVHIHDFIGDDAEVTYYNLSTPWDVSTATLTNRYQVALNPDNRMSVNYAITLKPDGTTMYLNDGKYDAMRQFRLGTD